MKIIEWNGNDYQTDMNPEFDEKYSGGLWDLAGDFAQEYSSTKYSLDETQSELYNLLRTVLKS